MADIEVEELLTHLEVVELRLAPELPVFFFQVESLPLPTQFLLLAADKPGEMQKVLQSLLRERVSIRDLETIVETLGEMKGAAKCTRFRSRVW